MIPPEIDNNVVGVSGQMPDVVRGPRSFPVDVTFVAICCMRKGQGVAGNGRPHRQPD